MIALKLAREISIKGQSITSAQPLAPVLTKAGMPVTGNK